MTKTGAFFASRWMAAGPPAKKTAPAGAGAAKGMQTQRLLNCGARRAALRPYCRNIESQTP